jgi:hypothetical protein
MRYSKKYVLAKTEVTYNTDPTPVAADAILTTNLTISPYEGNRVSRDLDRDYLGGQEEINTGPMVRIEFDVEIAGAGAAGDAPGYSELLLGCGFAETLTASTDAVYTPVSTGFDSTTLYYWLDGQQHIATGCRGTMSLNLQREELPKFHFMFDGNYNAPTAQATVTPVTTEFQDPLPVINTNTSLTLFTQSVLTEQVSCDLQNNVVARFLINGDEIIISDREPTCTLQFEAPDIGTYDFFNDMESHAGTTTGALQVIHGTVAGNIVQVDCPNVQIGNMTIQDSDGIVAYNVTGNLIPGSSGDDEITITVK